MAGTTGLEPAASAVTGQRSNQLNYVPTRQINQIHNCWRFIEYCMNFKLCTRGLASLQQALLLVEPLPYQTLYTG